MMQFLTPAEAEERFGCLVSTSPKGVRTWRQFGDHTGCWKPVFQGIDFLIGYEWEWY